MQKVEMCFASRATSSLGGYFSVGVVLAGRSSNTPIWGSIRSCVQGSNHSQYAGSAATLEGFLLPLLLDPP